MSASEQPVLHERLFFSYQNYSKLHDYVKYSPKTDFTAKSAQFCATILLSFLNYPGKKRTRQLWSIIIFLQKNIETKMNMHPCNHTVFGNLEQTLAKLMHADPNFVMGKVMNLSLQLLGENARQKPKLLYDVNNFADKAQKSNISSW